MPIYPSVGKVSREERSRRLGQRPLTVWLTGLSGAGKSTIGIELERRSAPYEAPQAPELELATGTRAIDDCVAEVLRVVNAKVRLA